VQPGIDLINPYMPEFTSKTYQNSIRGQIFVVVKRIVSIIIKYIFVWGFKLESKEEKIVLSIIEG
jgi:hypothetical protein